MKFVIRKFECTIRPLHNDSRGPQNPFVITKIIMRKFFCFTTENRDMKCDSLCRKFVIHMFTCITFLEALVDNFRKTKGDIYSERQLFHSCINSMGWLGSVEIVHRYVTISSLYDGGSHQLSNDSITT